MRPLIQRGGVSEQLVHRDPQQRHYSQRDQPRAWAISAQRGNHQRGDRQGGEQEREQEHGRHHHSWPSSSGSGAARLADARRRTTTATTAISQRIEQIAQMTERNTAAVQNTAQAVHRMSDMSREIADALSAYKV